LTASHHSEVVVLTSYQPSREEKFTFGLWTVGNVGGDPFGKPVRPEKSPVELIHLLAEVGAYGVNFHDNDLVPIDASPSERDRIVADFKQALDDTGLTVPMATTDLFSDPVFRDGAFTSSNAEVRRYALQKTVKGIDLGVEFGADTYVMWGGREGTETDVGKDPRDGLKRLREAINYLCGYVRDQGYDLKFALEAKPNEPRGDLYLPTTGAMLGFIETLDHPEMVGVNPEVAHETMAGLNFPHAVAQAWDAGKLFHIDLNDQNPSRYDQDFRFGAYNYKSTFFLVKFLEDVGYDGPKHFDAHAYRSEDYEGVRDFARGCMRSYMILKEKVEEVNDNEEIQDLLDEIDSLDGDEDYPSPQTLKEENFDRSAIAEQGLGYEKLDQLLFELLHGVR
jgi:xylose isomerase